MPKIDKTRWIAVISLLFSGFVYVNSQREARITAAIDLSIKNLYGDIADLRNSVESYIDGKVDLDVRNRVNAWFYYLDYVARLINEREIDESYVSSALKCQMHDFYAGAYLKESTAPVVENPYPSKAQVRDLEKFYKANLGLKCR